MPRSLQPTKHSPSIRRSAICRALNAHDPTKISISNIHFAMPDPSRSYTLSFSQTFHIKKNTEYHPPNPELTDEERSLNRLRSLRRARKRFRDLALANDFRYMLTLTLDPKNTKFPILNSPERIRQTFKDIHRNHKLTFKYLGVCERQKSGNVHLHILTTKELKEYLILNKFKYNSFVYWAKYGFSNIREINPIDYERQTSYLTKYLSKSPDSHYNYFRSRNLQDTKVFYNVNTLSMKVDSFFDTSYNVRVTILKGATKCKI